jgi:hypothetical protein
VHDHEHVLGRVIELRARHAEALQAAPNEIELLRIDPLERGRRLDNERKIHPSVRRCDISTHHPIQDEAKTYRRCDDEALATGHSVDS